MVYPREELLEYKDQYSLYWHYDTHWNYLGGYIGAKALLKELGIEIPEVEELTITQNASSGYDLAGMMNLRRYYEENKPADAVSYTHLVLVVLSPASPVRNSYIRTRCMCCSPST